MVPSTYLANGYTGELVRYEIQWMRFYNRLNGKYTERIVNKGNHQFYLKLHRYIIKHPSELNGIKSLLMGDLECRKLGIMLLDIGLNYPFDMVTAIVSNIFTELTDD